MIPSPSSRPIGPRSHRPRVHLAGTLPLLLGASRAWREVFGVQTVARPRANELAASTKDAEDAGRHEAAERGGGIGAAALSRAARGTSPPPLLRRAGRGAALRTRRGAPRDQPAAAEPADRPARAAARRDAATAHVPQRGAHRAGPPVPRGGPPHPGAGGTRGERGPARGGRRAGTPEGGVRAR